MNVYKYSEPLAKFNLHFTLHCILQWNGSVIREMQSVVHIIEYKQHHSRCYRFSAYIPLFGLESLNVYYYNMYCTTIRMYWKIGFVYEGFSISLHFEVMKYLIIQTFCLGYNVKSFISYVVDDWWHYKMIHVYVIMCIVCG